MPEDKEFYDAIRREVQEQERKKDTRKEVALERRAGITVFRAEEDTKEEGQAR